MDSRNQAQAAHNGHRQEMDISKSTLSATAAIFIPRSYQPPPPPQHEQMIPQEFQQHQQQQPEFSFQNNEGFAQQQQPGFDNFHTGGHRGGYGGGGYYNQNNNRGNYRGRGRGRGYRGGRGGRGSFHSNSYHGGPHGGPGGMGQHGGIPGHNTYMVPSQDPVEQIRQVISLLTDNPGMFDDTMQPLTVSLTTLIHNETEIQNVIEQLFGQSVRETNFRYTGARMCNYFSQNLHVKVPNCNFRQQLLKRCLDEHDKRDQLAQSDSTVNPLIGFTLFIGELLVNLTGAEDKQPEKDEQESQHVVHVLTTAIEELVNTLLSASFDNCLRCVVQVLKLTGSSLDKVGASLSPSGKPEMVDAIFDRIRALIQEERMQSPASRSLKIYLQSVVDLRATEWGKKETDGRPKQINPYLNMEVPTPLPDPNLGMMYDASGLPSFPVWSNGTPEFNSEPSDNRQQAPQPGGGQEVFWSPTEEDEYLAFMMSGEQEQEFQGEEMDEEIADAFEEFMRENAQRQQQQ